MITISNEKLQASFNIKGAELRSVKAVDTGLEYIWQAGPEWPKSAPVLFPVIGSLRNGIYTHNETKYKLGRHGFAREMEFLVTEQTASCVCFSLLSNDQTLGIYPFSFRLDITYALTGDKLEISYRIVNSGRENMHYSIGAHPAFRVPLEDGKMYSDYQLSFNKIENSPRWPITAEGLIKSTPVPCMNNTDRMMLEKKLFYEDAIVFKQPASDEIRLDAGAGTHGLSVSFPGFDYLGIWAVKDADFVCIEPWKGIADSETATGELATKEGILHLEAQQEAEHSWSVSFF